ncbi:MAG: hypothetical protein H6Q89_4013 [Myxococcaceae bacterium]|nr:hypothetical protein [Myxococcaceae bacterium]
MRGPVLLLLFLVSSACAERQQLPPGTDLESAEVAPHEEDAGTSDMPNASDKELATAWEPQKPPPPAPRPAEAPADEQTVERTLSAQAEAEARAKLKDLLVGGRQKLSINSLDDAHTIAVGALELAADLSPAEQAQAVELSFKVAFARADVPAAIKAAERWLKSCGPEKVDGCRGKALAALKSVGKLKGASTGTLTEKVNAVREADSCLQQAERKKAAVPCLDGALAFYRRQKDRLMIARVTWAKGIAALADPRRAGEVDGLLKRVETDCTEARCTALRRKALKTTATLALGAGDPEAAAAASLKEMRLGAALLPADKRPYARSADVDRICAAYDGKSGAGACRKLERRLNGEWVFRDFSEGKSSSNFPSDKVKAVNEHFSCLLQECLTLEADRLTPPESVTYDVQWSVTNDGRVGDVKLGRKDQEDGPMIQCLRKQFVYWRYPKYAGELQHVGQRFTVSAHERRTR